MMGLSRNKWSLIIPLISLWYIACSSVSVFEVKSDPLQADVYILDEKQEKKSLGKTPLQVQEPELKKILGENISSGEFFTVVIEKTGFVSQTFHIPASSFSSALTSLSVKFKEGNSIEESRLAKQIVDHLFLAQRLANAEEFDRAQLELDKILGPFPKFSRALSMRASIYFAQKKYDESMKWYEETLKIEPDMEEAVKMLAKVKSLKETSPKAK